ncbi:MAG: glycosyltransferase family 2 protein [bacterium]
MVKISCIIPAHNENPRIENVLRAICGHPMIYEIIVIDDGSQDDTAKTVKKFDGVKLIIHEKNKGKSEAVADGIARSKGDDIFLLDADLIGLTSGDINDLLKPIIDGEADASISLRKNSPWIFRKIGFDFISGERVFEKKLVQDKLDEIRKLPNFGLEVYLNKLIIKNKLRIKIIFWKNVTSPWPHKKNGIFIGSKKFLFMIKDILKTVSIFEIFRQLSKIYILKIK